ncbi:acyl-ACP--UDP-N-acetylglucosamine O-acyltransferase [Anaerobiospirillum sp. NML120448]|uniref:acyl-ACP--UDP-N-acetylglucosamine O-acyltransferase n=1 Tax=Anaerobiospirillum sp. NML120448 TaxID=2932816 RepID=UPI001FF47CFB|nr:acyl-ACP--UDP-N-acetylglucosamine O-acyltransferase [Anaerobiospirillum sp. NML120448]MCK0513459.1 acyl-ACP--UDP-N-acetylglucosamine O-acyltransferase [Anaerobiospirillum sp. NML120448]
MANSEASSAHKGEELTGSKAYPLVHTFEGQSTISSTAKIAPSAILRGKVVIGDDVIIKDNVIIEGEVTIGSGCVIEPFCVIRGPSVIGSNNHFYQFCSIGEANQDLKYKGEATKLLIGDDNTFREHCTVHRGTVQGLSETKIGSRNLFMVNAHVAHDCIIGNNCIFANNATLAGHVVIGDYVIFGGLSAIHQFGRVGSHAFVAGMAALNMDVPPYVMAAGHYAKPFGINKVGLARRGFSESTISAIKKAYMIIYHKHLTIEEAIPKLEELAQSEGAVTPLLDFIKENGRGIVR